MDLRFNTLSTAGLSTARMPRPAAGVGAPVAPAAPKAGGVQGGGFGDAFKVALQNVSAAQNQASELQTQVQMGNPKVSLEQTMVSMQKAQIGFQAALHVRNRMMQAYTDVMNMQV